MSDGCFQTIPMSEDELSYVYAKTVYDIYIEEQILIDEPRLVTKGIDTRAQCSQT
jgi:hypothetical protein